MAQLLFVVASCGSKMTVETFPGKHKPTPTVTADPTGAPGDTEVVNNLVLTRTYFQPGQAIVVKLSQEAMPTAGSFTLINLTTHATLIPA